MITWIKNLFSIDFDKDYRTGFEENKIESGREGDLAMSNGRYKDPVIEQEFQEWANSERLKRAAW